MKVAVIGGGPAGCAVAIDLARRGVAVRVIEAEEPRLKPGEVLAPGAVADLEFLGMTSDNLAAHLPCSGIDRVWGSKAVARVDFRARLQGGWHLDRAVFERDLRAICQAEGAQMDVGAGLQDVTRGAAGWQLRLADGRTCDADFLVDASGRRAVVASKLGVGDCVQDRLIAFHAIAECDDDDMPKPLFIEAVENGWWYTAPLPGGRRVFAFLTDSDLPAAHLAARAEGFWGVLQETRIVLGFLTGALAAPRPCPATSRRLERFAGPGWLAIGDAAIGRDPLSGGGMAQALQDGRKAAELIATCRKGGVEDPSGFNAHFEDVWANHETERAAIYGREQRWPWSPFWARRCRTKNVALEGQA